MKYHFMGLCFQRFVVQHLPRVPQSDRHAQIAVAPCQTARLSLRLRLLRCTREMTPAHFRIIVLLSKDIANGSSQQFRNFRIRRMVSCERAKDQYDSRYAMRKTDVVTSYTFFYGRQRRLPLKPIAVANSRAVQPTGGFRRECFIFTEMLRPLRHAAGRSLRHGRNPVADIEASVVYIVLRSPNNRLPTGRSA